jgi:hypothetical protein
VHEEKSEDLWNLQETCHLDKKWEKEHNSNVNKQRCMTWSMIITDIFCGFHYIVPDNRRSPIMNPL